MIALLFTAEPKAVEDFLKEVEKWEAEEEAREQQHYEDLRKYGQVLNTISLSNN